MQLQGATHGSQVVVAAVPSWGHSWYAILAFNTTEDPPSSGSVITGGVRLLVVSSSSESVNWMQ